MKSLIAAGILAGVTFFCASTAGAAVCEDSSSIAGDCVQVEAVVLEPAVVTPNVQPVDAAPTAVAAKQQLPVTGSDALGLGLAGAGLLLVGGVLVLRSKSIAAEG